MAVKADTSNWWRREASDGVSEASTASSSSSRVIQGNGRSSSPAAAASIAAGAQAALSQGGRQLSSRHEGTPVRSDEAHSRSWSSSYQQHSSSNKGRVRYEGPQLTAKLRGATTPQQLHELLDGRGSVMTGQHLSAAFKALSVMQAHPAAVQDLLQQQLVPMLDRALATIHGQHAPAAHSTLSSSNSSSSSSHNRRDASSLKQAAEPLLDGRACAVIMTSILALNASMRGPQRSQQGVFLQHTLSRLACDVLELFLTPSVLATATPQAFGMLAGGAAKLRLRTITEQQLQQLLSALLDAAATARHDEPDLLQPCHISQTLWGIATLLAAQNRTPPCSQTQVLMAQLALQLVEDPVLYATAKPVELVNTASAFVIAEAAAPPGLVADLMRALAQDKNVERAIPQDLSRGLWAAARLDAGREVAEDVYARMIGALCRPQTLGRAGAQDISNTLWGVASIQRQQHCCQDLPDPEYHQGSSASPDGPAALGQPCLNIISNQQVHLLVSRFLQQAEHRRATHTDLSAVCHSLAAMDAQLPPDMLQQLFGHFLQPHVLAQVSRDSRFTGITNVIWAATTLHRSTLQRRLQQLQPRHNTAAPPQPLLSQPDLQTLADMLAEPSRLRTVTPADISISVWGLAHLGFRLTQQQLVSLLQTFLQPRLQRDALPKHFQNVLWGVIRSGQQDVLKREGLLDQLVRAWFAAGRHGGAWEGQTPDPVAAANLLWAVAIVCKGEDTHEKRWLDAQARAASAPVGTVAAGDAAAAAATGGPAAAAAAEAEAEGAGNLPGQEGCQRSTWRSDAAPAPAQEDNGHTCISPSLLQRLFDSFMQHRSLAGASAIDISTVLWAAAVLKQPLAVDDLQWLLSAYMQPERLQTATAMSIANVMYGITHLQLVQQQQRQQQLNSAESTRQDQQYSGVSFRPNAGQATSSSSSRNLMLRRGVLGSAFTQQQESFAPALADLCSELVQHLQEDGRSQDVTAALLALTKCYIMLQGSSRGSRWVRQHQRLLQQALWQLLQGLLAILPAADITSAKPSPPKTAALSATAPDLMASSPVKPSSSSSSPMSSFSKSYRPVRGHYSWQQQQQLFSMSEQHGNNPCSLHTLVDACWASGHIGVAHTTFLAAVCSTALEPCTSMGGCADAGCPAVQQLPWSDVTCLLEKLASLNWLSPVVWSCALQPLLTDIQQAAQHPAHGCQQQHSTVKNHHVHLSSSSTSSTGSYRVLTQTQVQAFGKAASWVPRLCWAAAAGDCQECSGSVVLLCQLWVSYLKQQQCHQQQPGCGDTATAAAAVPVSDSISSGSERDGAANRNRSSCGDAFRRLDVESLCQLWQVHMWLQDSATASQQGGKGHQRGRNGLLDALSPEQLQLCETAWMQQTNRVTTTHWQHDVADVLRTLPGVSGVQVEALTPDGCFSVDVLANVTDLHALVAAAGGDMSEGTGSSGHGTGTGGPSGPTAESYQLAVEADGPSHFVLTGPSMQDVVLRGEARLRSAALAARRFALLRISYLEWKQLQPNAMTLLESGTPGVGGSTENDTKHCQLHCWLAGKVCCAVAAASKARA